MSVTVVTEVPDKVHKKIELVGSSLYSAHQLYIIFFPNPYTSNCMNYKLHSLGHLDKKSRRLFVILVAKTSSVHSISSSSSGGVVKQPEFSCYTTSFTPVSVTPFSIYCGVSLII